MFVWRVVRVRPGTETEVVQQLKNAGFTAWVALACEWRPIPGARAPAARREAFSYPLWTGYVLVRMTAPPDPKKPTKLDPQIMAQRALEHHAILGVDDVLSFLGEDAPSEARPEGVEAFQRRVKFGHYDQTRTRPPRELSPSDKANILIFRGLFSAAPTTAAAA